MFVNEAGKRKLGSLEESNEVAKFRVVEDKKATTSNNFDWIVVALALTMSLLCLT